MAWTRDSLYDTWRSREDRNEDVVDCAVRHLNRLDEEANRYATALEEIMSEYVPSSNKPSNATALWRIAANAINPIPIEEIVSGDDCEEKR